MTAPAAAPSTQPFDIAAERPGDSARVGRLIDAAFGPGRYAKTAERIREHARPRLNLSQCAWADGALVGAVRLCPIRIGRIPALFLGPIAVESAWRGGGIGAALATRACEAADAAGERIVLLVGDTPFFGPLGFERAPDSVRLPGPVDRDRLLWRSLTPGALDGVAGLVEGASAEA